MQTECLANACLAQVCCMARCWQTLIYCAFAKGEECIPAAVRCLTLTRTLTLTLTLLSPTMTLWYAVLSFSPFLSLSLS